MKKIAIRLCAMILTSSFLLAPMALAVETKDSSHEGTFVSEISGMTMMEAQRFESVVNAEAKTIAAVFDEDVTPKGTKNLVDFSGNAYTLIECAPKGYMIYHNASGQFVESSATSPSPYSGFNDNLYYGGPTEYYVLEDGIYVHTIIDETYDADEAEGFSETCSIANEYFLSEPQTDILQYIEDGTSITKDEPMDKAMVTMSASSPTYITNAYCLSNCETASEMSYFGKGACGYIAAAMLMLWFRSTIDARYLGVNNSNGYDYVKIKNNYPVFNGCPDTFYDGRTFSYNLWRWHSNFGTEDYQNGNYSSAAGDIADTLKSYVTGKGLYYDYLIDIAPSTSTVISRLDNKDRPYILFGVLQPADESRVNTFHGVIAYGHWNGYILCNFGWAGYNCSSVKGVWGSGYMMK